jgi:group I intron endonuclease
MIGIYKITSPTNKIYIGQSIDILLRFKYYKYLKCKSQKKIYASLVKYGVDKHKFEIIEECDIELLNERERYWQEHFEVIGKNGLNLSLTKTNDKSGKHSLDTINNIKKSLIGVIKKKPLPTKDSTKKLMSEIQKERLKDKNNHPMYGKKHSLESINKIKESLKNKDNFYLYGSNHQNSKLVLDVSNGIFYESVKELSELYNINYSTLKLKLNPNSKIKNNTNFIYV